MTATTTSTCDGESGAGAPIRVAKPEATASSSDDAEHECAAARAIDE
jgi:hypothetical protein